MNPEISTLIRSALKVIGGAFVAKGYIDADTMNALVGYAESAIGGIAAMGAIAWSLYAKRAASKEAAKIAARVPEAAIVNAINEQH